jgi:hypothetical protein
VGYQAFVQGSYDVTNYDDPRDDNGFERDSKGYQVVGGLSLDLTDLIIGEFFAGYFSEDFDDPEFGVPHGRGDDSRRCVQHNLDQRKPFGGSQFIA